MVLNAEKQRTSEITVVVRHLAINGSQVFAELDVPNEAASVLKNSFSGHQGE
jgi:hypothetical protein